MATIISKNNGASVGLLITSKIKALSRALSCGDNYSKKVLRGLFSKLFGKRVKLLRLSSNLFKYTLYVCRVLTCYLPTYTSTPIDYCITWLRLLLSTIPLQYRSIENCIIWRRWLQSNALLHTRIYNNRLIWRSQPLFTLQS